MKSYSALISVYNKENANYLNKAIKSILEQSIMPIQVVLVEDGVLNLELETVILNFKTKFEKKNIEFLIIKNAVNKGLGLCLNQGMAYCYGELIARFDSDDISDKTRMEKTLRAFDENEKVSVVGGQIAEFETLESGETRVRRVPLENKKIIEFAKSRNPMNHMTVTFKKSDILAVDGYENVPSFEDYYLWLKLIKNKFILANLPDILVLVRVGNNFEQRRKGLSYVKKEIYFEKKIYENHMISYVQFMKNISVRTLVRFLPEKLLKKVYGYIRS